MYKQERTTKTANKLDMGESCTDWDKDKDDTVSVGVSTLFISTVQ